MLKQDREFLDKLHSLCAMYTAPRPAHELQTGWHQCPTCGCYKPIDVGCKMHSKELLLK